MKGSRWLWTAVLAFGSLSAWAQPAPPEKGQGQGGPDGIPEMGDDQAPPSGGPGMGARRGGGRGMGGPGMGGPGMGAMGGMSGLGGPPEPLTEAQQKELLDFLKANEPKLAEQLEAVKQKDPVDARRQLAHFWHLYKEPDAREHFIKTSKTNRAVHELAAQYRKAQGKDRDAIKDKLAKAVGDMFDLSLTEREVQIKKQEERLSQMKEKVAKARSERDKHVAKRVEQMTGEGDDWEW